MQPILCEQVREWLNDAEVGDLAALPPLPMVQHVAGCAQCRGALLLLLADTLNVELSADAITCEECQMDLAAYIDVERLSGAVIAAQDFPQIWWHLWICPDCAETYRLIGELLKAEEDGLLPAMPLAPLAPALLTEVVAQLDLLRAMLNRMLAMPLRLGPAWGPTSEAVVLAEEERDGSRLVVSVQPQTGTDWKVMVQITPPVAGEAVLTLGAAVWRMPLDAGGAAVLAPIPATLLVATDGPDLRVAVETTI